MQVIMHEAQRTEKDRIDLQRRLATVLLNEKLHMAIIHFQAAFRGASAREKLQQNRHPWVTREMLMDARSRAHEAQKDLRGSEDGQENAPLGDSMGKSRVMYTILNAVLDVPNPDLLKAQAQAPTEDEWCMFVPGVDTWLFQLAMANFITDAIGTEVAASQLRATDCQPHEVWQTIVAWEFVDIPSQLQRSAFEALTNSDTPLDTYFTKWGLCQGGPNPVEGLDLANYSAPTKQPSATLSISPRSDLLVGAPIVQSRPTDEGQVDVVRDDSRIATQVNGQAAVIVKLASGPAQPPRQEHASPPPRVKKKSREASGQKNSNKTRSRQSPAMAEKEFQKRWEEEEALLKMQFMAQQIAHEESLKRQLQGKIKEGDFGTGTRHSLASRNRSSATPEQSNGLSAAALQNMGQVELAERVTGASTMPLPDSPRDQLITPGSTHERPSLSQLAVRGPQAAVELMKKREKYIETEKGHIEEVKKHRRDLRNRDLLLFQEWKAKAVDEIRVEKERITAEQQRLAEDQAARREDQQWAIKELERRKAEVEEETRLRKQWMKEDCERRQQLELELRQEDDEMLQKYLQEREAVRVERLQLEELKEELGQKKRDFIQQEVATKAQDLAVELELQALTQRMDVTNHEVQAIEHQLADAYEEESQEWFHMQQQMIEKQNEMDALALEIQLKNQAALTEDEFDEERQIFEEFRDWKRAQMAVPGTTVVASEVDQIVEENQLKADTESAALQRRFQVLEQAEAYSQAQDMQPQKQANPPIEKPNIGAINHGSQEPTHVELDRAQKALSDAQQVLPRYHSNAVLVLLSNSTSCPIYLF